MYTAGTVVSIDEISVTNPASCGSFEKKSSILMDEPASITASFFRLALASRIESRTVIAAIPVQYAIFKNVPKCLRFN